jgi:hypothetical protein
MRQRPFGGDHSRCPRRPLVLVSGPRGVGLVCFAEVSVKPPDGLR